MRVSDPELLERWRNGNPAAGKQRYDRYYYPIERFFLNKFSTEVEELVQDTFLGCEGLSNTYGGGHDLSYRQKTNLIMSPQNWPSTETTKYGCLCRAPPMPLGGCL